jgi:RimJ/RimL family protein N-acetyltransferase
MAWTAIAHAFGLSQISAVVAGSDQPNAASLAVMRRLGMRFHQNVQYPLGPGVEYVLNHYDPVPNPRPAEMHLA